MKGLYKTTQYLNASINMQSSIKVFLSILIIIISFSNSLAQRYWVGTGNWTAANTANWSASSGGAGGASVPVAGTNVIFDNNSGGCTITTNNAVCNNITLANNYANTLTQTNKNLTVSGTATFSGGTFTGGTAAITVTGAFTISGGAFTSTSGTLTLQNNFTISSGTFSHNNGTVSFSYVPLGGNFTVTGSPTFYNLSVVGYYGTFAQTNSMTVSNNLLLDGTNGWENINIGAAAAGVTLTVNGTTTIQGSSFIALNNGTLIENGGLTDNNTSPGVTTGNGTIDFAGTGTFSGPAATGEGELPYIVINTSGTLTLSGNISVTYNWTYTAGTIVPGSSTIYFDNDPSTTISGTQTLNNVTINGSYGTTTISNNLTVNNFTVIANASLTLAISSTLTVNGTLSVSGNSAITYSTGTINAKGNITITNTNTNGGSGGTATVNVSGSGNQTISNTTATYGQGCLPNVTIASTGGTVTLSGMVSTGSWTYSSGTVDASTNSSTVVIYNTLSTSTLTSVGMSFYNLMIAAQTVNLGSALTVSNNLTILATGNPTNLNTTAANSYAVTVGGNWTSNATFTANSSTVTLNGAGAQTIYQVTTGGSWPTSTYSGPFYNLTITNSSVSTITNNITVSHNLLLSGTSTLFSGVYSITGNAAGTFTMNAGTTLVLGAQSSATAVAFPSTYTTAHITLNSASTVIYQSNANQAVSTTPTSYGNLYLYSGNATSTKTFATTPISITGNLRVGDTTSAGVTVNALTKTFNVTGNLTINSDGNVSYTSGSGTLNLTGNFFSNGTYSAANTTNITGNFTNNGTFTQNTSTTTFNGTVQALGGTASTTFYNLTENGGAGGSLTISEPQVTVSNTLALTNDNIIVSNGDLLVLPTTVTPAGGSANSFVDGNMQAAIGSGATYTFPSGNGTIWARIGVVGVSSASTFQAQYFHSAPANQSSIAAGLDHVSTMEYWVLSEISGGTANVKLYSENALVNSGGIYDCPDLAVAHYTGGVWVDADPSVSGSGAGCNSPYTGAVTIATGTALASFSPFTFGSRVGGYFNNPMPINLVSFGAECVNYNALIQWETASEVNNNYFTIEKTIDGEYFEPVGIVKGSGTTSTSHSYSMFDYNPANGYSYYRLSQTNYDGTKIQLQTAVYAPCEKDENIEAYGSANNIIVRINSNENGSYKILLTNVIGQVLFNETKNVVQGENIFKPVQSLNNGIYILQVTGGGKVYTRKIFL